jgi:hypothetical protein
LVIDISFLGTIGTLSIIFLFYILARLSERLGSVEKMEPIYRYYYVAIFFLAVGYLTQLLMANIDSASEDFPTWLTSAWFPLLGHHIPLTVGVSIGLAVTWRYWSWLVMDYKK